MAPHQQNSKLHADYLRLLYMGFGAKRAEPTLTLPLVLQNVTMTQSITIMALATPHTPHMEDAGQLVTVGHAAIGEVHAPRPGGAE
jgi:hypothetical protein